MCFWLGLLPLLHLVSVRVAQVPGSRIIGRLTKSQVGTWLKRHNQLQDGVAGTICAYRSIFICSLQFDVFRVDRHVPAQSSLGMNLEKRQREVEKSLHHILFIEL